MKYFIIFLTFFILSCGENRDTSDFQNKSANLPSIKIGSQEWTKQNLIVDKFRNGEDIPQAKNLEEWEDAARKRTPAWCYPNFDKSKGDKHGKLYNFYAVIDKRGLAPHGWHIGSDDEWKELAKEAGGKYKAGAKLKSTYGWYKDGNGINDYGFNALPTGYVGAQYMDEGRVAMFWCSSKSIDATAMGRILKHNKNDLIRTNIIANTGASIRCVKD